MDAASPNSASLLPLDDLKAALLARAHVDTGRLVQSPDPDLLALRCMGQDSITDFDRCAALRTGSCLRIGRAYPCWQLPFVIQSFLSRFVSVGLHWPQQAYLATADAWFLSAELCGFCALWITLSLLLQTTRECGDAARCVPGLVLSTFASTPDMTPPTLCLDCSQSGI